MPRHIGFLLYPDLTQLDLTGPYQVFAALPDSQIHLIARTAQPVTSMAGLQLQPTQTFTNCPQLDFICVPVGNLGTAQQMTDPETLNFLRHQAQTAQQIQLMIEYNPAPPFNSNSPEVASEALIEGNQAIR